jgi:hypothetical protein
MSNVSRFVERNAHHAAAPQQNPERAAHANPLKVSITRRKNGKGGASSKVLAGTAPAVGYASNYTGAQNTVPQQQYHPQLQPPASHEQPLPYAKNMFDQTLSSGFDITKSIDGTEMGEYLNNGEYFQVEEEEAGVFNEDKLLYPYPERRDSFPEDNRGKPPLQPQLPHRGPQNYAETDEQITQTINVKPVISGRFQRGHARPQDIDLEPRSASSTSQHHHGSKKRTRDTETRYDTDDWQLTKHQDADNGQLPQPHLLTPGSYQNQPQENGNNAFEQQSEGESLPSCDQDPGTRDDDVVTNLGQVIPEEPIVPDYDDGKLSKMTYQDLKNETWENEYPVREEMGSLEHRFNQSIITKEWDDEEQQRADNKAFFIQLSFDEWEEAGDLIIGGFGDKLQQLKEARKAKRAIVAEFEKEIEQREGNVRGQLNSLDTKLRDMKRGGEDVLNGKTV